MYGSVIGAGLAVERGLLSPTCQFLQDSRVGVEVAFKRIKIASQEKKNDEKTGSNQRHVPCRGPDTVGYIGVCDQEQGAIECPSLGRFGFALFESSWARHKICRRR